MSYGNIIMLPQNNNLRPTNSLDVNTASSASVNLKDGSQIFGNEDELSHNRTTQPIVTLPASGPQKHNCNCLYNFPNNSHPVVQPPVISGASKTLLSLPKQSSQRTNFSFVGKSGKTDVFSFVQEETRARNRFLSKIILSLKNDLLMSELLYDRDVITIVIPTVECIKAALKMKVVYLQ